MNIETLINNPLLKKMFLSKLETVMQENNIKLLTVFPKENGDLDFGVYYEDQKIIPQKDFIELLNQLTK